MTLGSALDSVAQGFSPARAAPAAGLWRAGLKAGPYVRLRNMIRWYRFNAVGLIGVAVQLAMLHLLVSAGMPYLVATAAAVESAVLHNFIWHERWTWRERAAAATRWTRLAGFHAGNGLISLLGNLVLMRIFVGMLGVPVVAANLTAIAICSTINFFVSDAIVYRRAPR